MPNNQIEKGYDFSTGQLVTADNLDNLAQEASLRKGAISEQPAQTEPLTDADEIIVNDVSDTSATKPKKATIAQIFSSRIDITAKTINAPAGENITLNPSDGTVVAANAFSSVDGLNVSVNRADHALTVGQLIEVSAALSGVIAKPAYNGKYKVTEITSTSVFVYRLNTATDPITGTLSYKKEGAVVINNNLLINADVDFSNTISFKDGTLILPKGTTANRPATAVAGTYRYNTDTQRLEYYDGTDWYYVVRTAVSTEGEEAPATYEYLGDHEVVVTGESVTIPAAPLGYTTYEFTTPVTFSSSITHNISIPADEWWGPPEVSRIYHPLAALENPAYYNTLRTPVPLSEFPNRHSNSVLVPSSSTWQYSLADTGINGDYTTPALSQSEIDAKPFDDGYKFFFTALGKNSRMYINNSTNAFVTRSGNIYRRWLEGVSTFGSPYTAFETAYSQNSYVFFTDEEGYTVNFSGDGDGGLVEVGVTQTSSINSPLFYIKPQYHNTVNGTDWTRDRLHRGGQNFVLRRKAYTFDTRTRFVAPYTFTEGWVIRFKRYRRIV